VRIWQSNGLKSSTIGGYRRWVRRFREDCRRRGRIEEEEITRRGVARFVGRYIRARGIDPAFATAAARRALHAWSWGLAAFDHAVSQWFPPLPPTRLSRGILGAFTQHRLRGRGVAESTLDLDLRDLREFLPFLRSRGRAVAGVRLADIDAYVVRLRQRLALRTVARICSTLRAFLRFLHACGRLRHDLASSVAAPLVRRGERPPRALPWTDVRRILRAVDCTTRSGRRDYALLLTMAIYGMGAGEVLGLRLEDIDWRRGILRVVRAKTGREVLLPLLAPVTRALVAYLRHGRPRHTTSRALFVRMHAPYGSLSGAAPVCHVLHKHARAAGICAPFLGSHALRHSHATRQFDLGAPPKVVGDILGHRDPESTSVYVRVALRRLRRVALPVPR
jgi:site-specific recombinase XerD